MNGRNKSQVKEDKINGIPLKEVMVGKCLHQVEHQLEVEKDGIKPLHNKLLVED